MALHRHEDEARADDTQQEREDAQGPRPAGDQPGAHPVATGLGATGGAAAGGVIGGTLVGPAGAAVGAALGAMGGGLAAQAAAKGVDPAHEDAYWRDNYHRRPYADDTLSYDHYRPAYRYGWESRTRHDGRRWDEVERELERGWRENRGASRLGWSDARLAARDAWQRVENRRLDERERAAVEAEAAAGDDGASDSLAERDNGGSPADAR
jgi:hypothetical protein